MDTTSSVLEASPWLTAAEVARISRRHRDTVLRALKSSELHGHQRHPRGPWLVHVESVTAWIANDDSATAALASARACLCGRVRELRRPDHQAR